MVSATTLVVSVLSAAALTVCSARNTANSWMLDATGTTWTSISSTKQLAYLKGRDEALVFGQISSRKTGKLSLYVSQLSKDNELGKLALINGVSYIYDTVPHPTENDSVVVLGKASDDFVGVLKANGKDDFVWKSVEAQTHSRPQMQKIVAFGDYCVVGGMIPPSDYTFVAFDLNNETDLNVLWAKRQRLDWGRKNATDNGTDDFILWRIDSMAAVSNNTLVVASTAFAGECTYASVLCSYKVSREGMDENWCQRSTYDNECTFDSVNQIYAVATDIRNPELVLVGSRKMNAFFHAMIRHIRMSDGFLKATFYWPMHSVPRGSSVIHYAHGTANPIVEVGGYYYTIECHRIEANASVMRYDVTAQRLAEVVTWNNVLSIDAMTVSSNSEVMYVGIDPVLGRVDTMTSTDCFRQIPAVERVTANDVHTTAADSVLFGDFGVDMETANETMSFSYLNCKLATTKCFTETATTTSVDDDDGHNSLSAAAVAGIVIGIMAVAFLLAVAVCYRRKLQTEVEETERYQGLVEE